MLWIMDSIGSTGQWPVLFFAYIALIAMLVCRPLSGICTAVSC